MRDADEHKRIKLRPTENMPGVQNRPRRLSTSAILGIILFFLFWISLVFVVDYKQFFFTPSYIYTTVARRFAELYRFLSGAGSPFSITFYQYLCVILIGAGLAACGCVLQGSFKNVLAGPSSMGAMSGGTLGCMAYVLLYAPAASQAVYTVADLTAPKSFMQLYALPVFIFCGCIIAVGVVLIISFVAGKGKMSSTAMILSGTVFSSISNNALIAVQYHLTKANPYDPRIELIRKLSMGSVSSIYSVTQVLMLAVPILLCVSVLLAMRVRLNVLSLGEDEAATMGLNVRRYRIIMVLITSVVSAAVLSICGQIGFVGFMAALLTRKIAGPDMRVLLPNAILLGAILLVIIFNIAVFAGLTDYLNVITSAVGCIMMIITVFNKQGGGANESAKRRNSPNMAVR